MKELVITNIGTIVTGKLTDPITDCNTIAIREGMIAEIGGEELLKNDQTARIVDAKGVTVAPGLIDSHCHPCAGDYTFRQKTDALIESEVHGGVTTIISAGEPHFPGRPRDAAGVKAQAVFLSKCFRNQSPLGAKVHGGAVILEQGLTEADFEEMAREGVWLVGEVGLGSVKSPEDAAPLVAMAKRHGFKVHMHTGGTSIPGSSSVTAEDVIRTDPDIASHCNGGPTAVSMAEVERIIRESEVAVEIVQCGNYRMTNGIMKLISELGMEHRVIFGNDAPSGTGVIPLGIIRNICYVSSVCGIAPHKAIAMATGNTASVFGLRTGVIEPGRPADLICLDAPIGSVGRTALEAIEAGDIPGITCIVIDGKIVVQKSRNTPPGNREPNYC
ncbi:MAG: amidohydrolase family protein [Ruminococcus sp.]|jgi:enamidase|nr:amidohydrolase family protein [Ruminococcus sp.]